MPDPTESLRWPAYPWTGPSYVLRGTCGNCDRTALVTVARGHEAPSYRNGPECPYCGCARWVGLRAPEDAPEKDMLAGLRAAAQIPHTRINDYAPSDDVVASLADLLAEAEGSAEGNGYVAMARAALSAIGAREAAFEGSLGMFGADEPTVRKCIADGECYMVGTGTAQAVLDAFSLPPSAAAEAVRHLAACADGGAQTLAQVSLWLRQHPETAAEFERDLFPADSLLQICASIARAARPFGEGDA
jgi:hypothetical protein